MRDWGNQLINLAFVHGRRQANYQRWTADYETAIAAETARQAQRDRLTIIREESALITGRAGVAGEAYAAGTSVTAQRDARAEALAETKRATDTVRYTAMGKARGLEGSFSSAEDVQMGMLMRKTDIATLASQRLEKLNARTIAQYPDDAPQIEVFDTLEDYEQFYREKATQKRAAEAKAKTDARTAATDAVAADKLAYSRAKDRAAEKTKRLRFAAKQRAHTDWEDEMSGIKPTDDGWWDFDKWWTARGQEYVVSDVTVEEVLRRDRLGGGGQRTVAPGTGGGQRIRVILKATGQPGTIPPEEFDPAIYERVQ